MRRRAAIVLLNLVAGLILMLTPAWPGQRVAVTSAAGTGAGYADFSYQHNSVIAPTADKPQSKLWYNDGRWWGSLFNRTTGAYHIYWLNIANQTWVDTGTQLDNRSTTRADCLWDGTHLYVASGSSEPGMLFRYSYNEATRSYTRDFGPVLIRSGAGETIVLDKDSTGKLWITYTQNGKVWVNHSTTADSAWNPAAAYNPPMGSLATSVNVEADDLSSLVAFDGKIGVLWSNQLTKAFYFAYHVDGAADSAWTGGVAASQGSTPIADDHINLKALQADSAGNVFAVVKTSTTPAQILLLVRRAGGTWDRYTVSSDGGQTRAMLQIDTDSRQLYVFTANTSGGSIYYKQSSIDNIQFSSGAGTLFIGGIACGAATCSSVNDPTSSKRTTNGATGIVVLANDDPNAWYLHNYLDLGPEGPQAVFATEPSGGQIDAPLSTQPVVLVQDTPGHTDTSYNGPISIGIKSGTGTPGAALGGALTVQALSGVATFSDLSIDTPGSGYRLTAAASGVSSADSGAFTVTKIDQAITFAAPPNKIYGDAPFALAATASSGLPVSYSAAGKCTLVGSTVTITGAGNCTVTASQPGDARYNPAPDVARTFAIAKASQSISFAALTSKRPDSPPFAMSAVASSGLPVSYSAVGKCTIAGNTVTITGSGTCTVTASQPGDANYRAAANVAQSFAIVRVFRSYLPLMLGVPAGP